MTKEERFEILDELLSKMRTDGKDYSYIEGYDYGYYMGYCDAEVDLRSRICKNCKFWDVRNDIVNSNECSKWSDSVMTTKDFGCNKFEQKGKKDV